MTSMELGLSVGVPGDSERTNKRGVDESEESRKTPVTMLATVELILHRPERVNHLVREIEVQPELMRHFLAIALIGFTLFGVAIAVVFSATGFWPATIPMAEWLEGESSTMLHFVTVQGSSIMHWWNGQAIKLLLAYNFGLIAAVGVCLPSFYFYGLLAGVRMSMLEVAVLAMRGQATTAITLVGILPIYVAAVLGVSLTQLPNDVLLWTFGVGLALPFIAGLAGVKSMYSGMMSFADTMSDDGRQRRACFLSRLLVSWATCYTAIAPLMILTVWQFLSR